MDYTEGLSSSQKTQVRKKVDFIADTHLKSVREVARTFREIYDTIKEAGDRNWLAFCSSNETGYGARTIRDYVKAHTWLESRGAQDIPDSVLGRLSVRSMSLMVGIPDKSVRDAIENRLRDGEILSQSVISEMIDSKVDESSNEEKTLNRKELNVLVAQLTQDAQRLAEERDWWKERCLYIESINKLEKSVYVERERPDDIIMSGTRKKARKQLVSR